MSANVGIGELAPLGAVSDKPIEIPFDVNVKGAICTVQKTLPILRPGSSFTLKASIVVIKRFAIWSVYSAAKAAVRLAAHGLRISKETGFVSIRSPWVHRQFWARQRGLNNGRD